MLNCQRVSSMDWGMPQEGLFTLLWTKLSFWTMHRKRVRNVRICLETLRRGTQMPTGWWYTYPSEKWWSSSVGIMTFPRWWESHKSHVLNHQPVNLSLITMITHRESPLYHLSLITAIIKPGLADLDCNTDLILIPVGHQRPETSPWRWRSCPLESRQVEVVAYNLQGWITHVWAMRCDWANMSNVWSESWCEVWYFTKVSGEFHVATGRKTTTLKKWRHSKNSSCHPQVPRR